MPATCSDSPFREQKLDKETLESPWPCHYFLSGKMMLKMDTRGFSFGSSICTSRLTSNSLTLDSAAAKPQERPRGVGRASAQQAEGPHHH